MQARAGIGLGAFMEKKIGNLDMKGRRASTAPVLSQNLANSLRSYLPALSRLPRSWSLVYSLDQHGISLNALYTRCEEVLSPEEAIYPSTGLGTRGVLLIIKDAGSAGEGDEGAFGAWVADGGGFGMGKKVGKDILVVVVDRKLSIMNDSDDLLSIQVLMEIHTRKSVENDWEEQLRGAEPD